MRNCNLLRLLTLSGFLSLAVLPRHAAAQWPTLDISSVKEGISTNIELVKQSKVVTDAMATAGKINAGIGEAKASVSKFAGDNLAKAQEKMKKLQEEKERIEKKKEEYEKIKKEIEEKKEAMEDYKRQAEALKADAEGYIADAKEMKDAAMACSLPMFSCARLILPFISSCAAAIASSRSLSKDIFCAFSSKSS